MKFSLKYERQNEDEDNEKAFISISAILSLAATNVFAAERTLNGGPKENTYVEGQKDGSPVETKAPPKEGRHFGDGSVENKQ